MITACQMNIFYDFTYHDYRSKHRRTLTDSINYITGTLTLKMSQQLTA